MGAAARRRERPQEPSAPFRNQSLCVALLAHDRPLGGLGITEYALLWRRLWAGSAARPCPW